MNHLKTRQLLQWKYTYVYTSESSVSDFILRGVTNTEDHNMNLHCLEDLHSTYNLWIHVYTDKGCKPFNL